MAVGWPKVGDARAFPEREALRERLRSVYGYDSSVVTRGTRFLWPFVHEIEQDDAVLIYSPGARIYAVGRVAGPYRFDPEAPELDHEGEPYSQVRDVRWGVEVARDRLSKESRNSLGLRDTVFRFPRETEAEVCALAEGRGPP